MSAASRTPSRTGIITFFSIMTLNSAARRLTGGWGAWARLGHEAVADVMTTTVTATHRAIDLGIGGSLPESRSTSRGREQGLASSPVGRGGMRGRHSRANAIDAAAPVIHDDIHRPLLGFQEDQPYILADNPKADKLHCTHEEDDHDGARPALWC